MSVRKRVKVLVRPTPMPPKTGETCPSQCPQRCRDSGVWDASKQTGAARSILKSSDAGYNLYLQMGYRRVASYAVSACG